MSGDNTGCRCDHRKRHSNAGEMRGVLAIPVPQGIVVGTLPAGMMAHGAQSTTVPQHPTHVKK